MLGDGVLKGVACRVTVDGTAVEESPVEARVFCCLRNVFAHTCDCCVQPFGFKPTPMIYGHEVTRRTNWKLRWGRKILATIVIS